MEFEKLIDSAIMILSKEMNKKEYSIFYDRYMKMDNSLKKTKISYRRGEMNNKILCLNVARMLDYGDSEELKIAIIELNNYYQEHIYVGE